MTPWPVFTGVSEPHDAIRHLPAPPPWRAFNGGPVLEPPRMEESSPEQRHRARTYRPTGEAVQLVNAALYLRRPLLVTGPPGSGKSSLPYAVARELSLGPVLRWNITSRTTLEDGLYSYDPLSRLYAASRAADGGPVGGGPRDRAAGEAIEDHLRLGPLGTALLPYEQPRVLLIDEIDKCDLNLPNDLLNVLEGGQYEIPELVRAARGTPEAEVMIDGTDQRVSINRGQVRCRAFPFVVLTSNGEREFPPAFLRRCITLRFARPGPQELEEIVRAHLGALDDNARRLVDRFLIRAEAGELATDQLLNAIYLTGACGLDADSRDELAEHLMAYIEPESVGDDFL
ncbi:MULTISPECIES: AAA family ATPase [unclassified Kitasatospora]